MGDYSDGMSAWCTVGPVPTVNVAVILVTHVGQLLMILATSYQLPVPKLYISWLLIHSVSQCVTFADPKIQLQ